MTQFGHVMKEKVAAHDYGMYEYLQGLSKLKYVQYWFIGDSLSILDQDFNNTINL